VVLYNARVHAIAERLGKTIEGKNVIDLLHDLAGLERADVVRRFAAVVLGEPMTLEVRPQGKAGRHYRFNLSAVRLRAGSPAAREEGPVLGLVATFSDITVLK